jgi:hypothetical protein
MNKPKLRPKNNYQSEVRDTKVSIDKSLRSFNKPLIKPSSINPNRKVLKPRFTLRQENYTSYQSNTLPLDKPIPKSLLDITKRRYIYIAPNLLTQSYVDSVLDNNNPGVIYRDVNSISDTGVTWKERYSKGEDTEAYVYQILVSLGIRVIRIAKFSYWDAVHRLDLLCPDYRIAIQVKSSKFLFDEFIHNFIEYPKPHSKKSPLCINNQLNVVWVPSNPSEKQEFIAQLASLFHIIL